MSNISAQQPQNASAGPQDFWGSIIGTPSYNAGTSTSANGLSGYIANPSSYAPWTPVLKRSTPAYDSPPNSESLGTGLSKWFSNGGNQMLVGTGLGIAQLGLGYLQFQDAQKTAKAQRKLMSQQISNNQDIMNNRTAKRNAMEAYAKSRV